MAFSAFGIVSRQLREAVRQATPSRCRCPASIGSRRRSAFYCRRSRGFYSLLVVLLLFIAKWPDLRRGLVMTFASRDSRLTVFKILNEIEAGLASYLLTV